MILFFDTYMAVVMCRLHSRSIRHVNDHQLVDVHERKPQAQSGGQFQFLLDRKQKLRDIAARHLEFN